MSSYSRLNINPVPVAGPSVWSAETLRARHDWLIELTAVQSQEIVDSAERALALCDGDLTRLTRFQFVLPTLGRRFQALRQELLHGAGFLQLRGLVTDGRSRELTATAFWGIGLHIGGDAVASQNRHGHLLGHVTNLGESRDNAAQRGPYSNERIPFHVDCCDVVGLMCLAPARSGGESSIVNSGFLFNEMLQRKPRLAAALMQPVYRDRRDEVPAGKQPWYALPVFNQYAGLMSVSIEPTYIGSVARHFDGIDPHTDTQLEGIEYAQALADELHVDIDFEPGDIQFVHNHVIMHSRKAFEDDPAAPRHLLRLWLLARDGRPLPDCFYGRMGDRATIARPGGIFAGDTRTNVPYFSQRELNARP